MPVALTGVGADADAERAERWLPCLLLHVLRTQLPEEVEDMHIPTIHIVATTTQPQLGEVTSGVRSACV